MQSISRKIIIYSIIAMIFFVFCFNSIHYGYAWEWEFEWEDDWIKNFGVAAFILFSLGFLYIIVFQLMRLILKLNKEKERNVKIQKIYQNFFKVVRKPLLYLHYIAGAAGIAILLVHGIGMSPEDNEQAVLGWITASFLIFYVLSGLLVKLKIPGLVKAKKLRKYVGIIHRSIILILIVLSIHLIHVLE